MSSSIHHYALIFLFLAAAVFSVSGAAKSKPRPLLFSIRKDLKTLQYYTSLQISTRENYVPLVLNLRGPHTWFNCDAYKLPNYKPLMCGSRKCKEYKAEIGCMRCPNPHTPGCTDDSCAINSYNPFAYYYDPQSLGEDDLFVVDTNGVAVGLTYETPQAFQFTCSETDLLKGLSNETKGMLGLANTPTSLHAQLSKQFKIPHKFALCLPSTSEYALGHMFIGGGPYYFLPYSKDIAEELLTTPLVVNPFSTFPVYEPEDPTHEYFVNVTYINVDHKPVSFNASLLSINEIGHGGTKFGNPTPYTILETSIYKGLVSAFTKAAAFRKMKKVSSVAPFGACYKAKSIAKSQTGPVVPYIDIGLSGNTHWRLYGANSMAAVKKDVLCLAFVDGGSGAYTSIVIGGHQMENYLIEFDQVSLKLGISTSLLFRNTTCTQSRVM